MLVIFTNGSNGVSLNKNHQVKYCAFCQLRSTVENFDNCIPDVVGKYVVRTRSFYGMWVSYLKKKDSSVSEASE